jgi:hypothetical protein
VKTNQYLPAILVLAAITSLPGSAEAKIQCRDGYQIVQGNLLATPYCQEEQLARVARGYGMRVSFAEIRNNPNTKRHVCSIVGRDIRVQQTCIDAGITGRRGF